MVSVNHYFVKQVSSDMHSMFKVLRVRALSNRSVAQVYTCTCSAGTNGEGCGYDVHPQE
jgi:hypothetical protein